MRPFELYIVFLVFIFASAEQKEALFTLDDEQIATPLRVAVIGN